MTVKSNILQASSSQRFIASQRTSQEEKLEWEVECTCSFNSIGTSFRSLLMSFSNAFHTILGSLYVDSMNLESLHSLRLHHSIEYYLGSSTLERVFSACFRFFFGSIRSCATAKTLLLQSICWAFVTSLNCGFDQTNSSRNFMTLDSEVAQFTRIEEVGSRRSSPLSDLNKMVLLRFSVTEI